MLENFQERIATFVAPHVVERRNHFERLANTDALTGLANSAAFYKAQPSSEADESLSFIVFDANNFGKVNKEIGFIPGTDLLKKFGSEIGFVARKFSARAFRLGGDEFAIICHKRFAEKIRDAVELRVGSIHFKDFAVSISGEIGETLRIADSRLQARKKLKKGEFSSGTN